MIGRRAWVGPVGPRTARGYGLWSRRVADRIGYSADPMFHVDGVILHTARVLVIRSRELLATRLVVRRFPPELRVA